MTDMMSLNRILLKSFLIISSDTQRAVMRSGSQVVVDVKTWLSLFRTFPKRLSLRLRVHLGGVFVPRVHYCHQRRRKNGALWYRLGWPAEKHVRPSVRRSSRAGGRLSLCNEYKCSAGSTKRRRIVPLTSPQLIISHVTGQKTPTGSATTVVTWSVGFTLINDRCPTTRHVGPELSVLRMTGSMQLGKRGIEAEEMDGVAV